MRAGTCKSCKAAIVWIRTQEGKSMPCDAAPVYYTAKPKSDTAMSEPPSHAMSKAKPRRRLAFAMGAHLPSP